MFFSVTNILLLFFSHVIYNKDGVEHLRMKFYIEGLRKKATVFLEMREVGI